MPMGPLASVNVIRNGLLEGYTNDESWVKITITQTY